jgi:hypothetical protein
MQDNEEWLTFVCEDCGIPTTRLRDDHDGFNVCRECRWFGERPWIKRTVFDERQR